MVVVRGCFVPQKLFEIRIARAFLSFACVLPGRPNEILGCTDQLGDAFETLLRGNYQFVYRTDPRLQLIEQDICPQKLNL